MHHDDAPFTVAGVLASTGTPVDRTVHVSPAVLRAVGAGPGWVFALLIVESAMLAATAGIVGVAAAHGAMFAGRAVLEDRFGLALAGGAPGLFDLAVVVGVTLAGVLAAAFPAWRAYRCSLADGLAMRV